MQARLVQRRYVFVRVDPASQVLYPIVAVAGLCLIGAGLVSMKVVSSFYASPFVLLCAVVSNRVCLRAGLIAATLSIVAHEYFFSAPYYEINLPSREQFLAYLSNYIAAWAVARKIPAPPSPLDPAQPLPFTHSGTSDDSTRSFWAVDADDDWIADCEVGAEYGRIYVDRLRSTAACPPLGWIVKDMIGKGRYSGVEAGFFSVVGRAASARIQPYPKVPDHLQSDDHADNLH